MEKGIRVFKFKFKDGQLIELEVWKLWKLSEPARFKAAFGYDRGWIWGCTWNKKCIPIAAGKFWSFQISRFEAAWLKTAWTQWVLQFSTNIGAELVDALETKIVEKCQGYNFYLDDFKV